jgi:HEPN domain-containing protein/predicted nucleotidyltransferase
MDEALLGRIRDGLKRSRLAQVVGAVVFGSRARGTATSPSDIDLLVVAQELRSKPHRRAEEIAGIKRHLPALALDVLLLTAEEAQSNFRNHNPLFLDIAAEGIVLVDDQGWLRGLMEEVREYIKQKGIEKTEHGWRFPVIPGIPTYLSKVTNKDFSLAMLKDGERDYLIGQSLMGDDYFDKAVYHFQQAVEKCIKSILIVMGIFAKTHFVGAVLRANLSAEFIPAEWQDELTKLAEISEGVEPEVSLSRYPGIIQDRLWLPFEEYEKKDAEKAREKAPHVLGTAKRFVDDWFSRKR